MLLLLSPGSANGKKKSPGEASFFVDEMAVQGAGNKNQSWGGRGSWRGTLLSEVGLNYGDTQSSLTK